MQLTESSIAEHAEQMIRQVERNGGPPLDFDEESLRLLDLLFRRNDPDFAALSEAQRQVTVFYNGCFLGCALAALLGGRWVLDGDWPDAAIVFSRSEGTGVQARPFEKIWRRLDEGEAGNGFLEYYEALRDLTRSGETSVSENA